MRADKLERHKRLCELIEQTIAEAVAQGEECEFEGHHWAIRPQPEWAAMLGVSMDTITDLIKEPPIRRTYTQVDGKRAVLLRVGEPVPLTAREIANIMKARFRKATGQDPETKCWGMLKGLGSVDKFEPVSGGGDMDHAEEAVGQLVVAGGDGAVDLDMAEHALDAVALLVERSVMVDLHAAV